MSESAYKCAWCSGELFVTDPIYHTAVRCWHCQKFNTVELAGGTPFDPFFELRKATDAEAHSADVLIERLRAMSRLLMMGEQIDLDSLKDEIPPPEPDDEA